MLIVLLVHAVVYLNSSCQKFLYTKSLDHDYDYVLSFFDLCRCCRCRPAGKNRGFFKDAAMTCRLGTQPASASWLRFFLHHSLLEETPSGSDMSAPSAWGVTRSLFILVLLTCS